MEVNKTVTIEALDKEGVIIHTKDTIDYNGQQAVLYDAKIYYPNSDNGREKFTEAVQAIDMNVYNAVMLIWGDTPMVDESITSEDEAVLNN